MVFYQVAEKIRVRARRGDRVLAEKGVESAQVAKLPVAGKLASEALYRRVLVDNSGKERVPCRSYGIVVATTTAMFLESEHQFFVGKMLQ